MADGDPLDSADDSIDLVLSIGVLEYLADPSHPSERTRKGDQARGKHYRDRPEWQQSLEAARSSDPRADRFAARKVAEARHYGGRARHGRQRSGPSSRIPSIRHRHMTVDELRRMGIATGLTVVDDSHVSLYVASELIPGAATLNDAVSRALSDRPYAKWLQRLTALVLVARFEKPSSSP